MKSKGNSITFCPCKLHVTSQRCLSWPQNLVSRCCLVIHSEYVDTHKYGHISDIQSNDTNRKIRTTFFLDYCVWMLVLNSKQDMHSAFCGWLLSPQTSPVFTVLLLEPFLEPQMYMNLVFKIFVLVSLLKDYTKSVCKLKKILLPHEKCKIMMWKNADQAKLSINLKRSWGESDNIFGIEEKMKSQIFTLISKKLQTKILVRKVKSYSLKLCIEWLEKIFLLDK